MSSDFMAENAALMSRLAEAEATIRALLAGEVDAVVDPRDQSPVLLTFAQKALRDSEARYRSIVETANEGIWLIDLEGTISFANARLANMLGYAVHEVIGRTLYDFLPPTSHTLAMDRLCRAHLSMPEESEEAVLNRAGHEITMVVRTSAIFDDAGACVGVLAMMTDVSRRSEAERALRSSMAEYRQIVENTTDGIIKLDPAGTIVFANARIATMLGYEPAELVGMHILSIVHDAEHANVRAALALREQGERKPTDTIYKHKSGSDISVNIAGAALRNEKGEFTGILGLVRDVTERNRLQSELIVSDRMASVGTMAAGVAHEINNPLSAAISNLEYLKTALDMLQADGALASQATWLRERFVDPLADAQEAARRVRRIVRDLMVFSRSPVVDASSSVDVNAVLESSLRMATNEIRHRAQLVKELRDVPAVRADEARLGQVFLNLIMNAVQALPLGHVDDHTIRVATMRSGATVVVEISDTGVGIDPMVIDRIFDAFYTTKPAGEGTGLGLAICRRLMSDVGGTLTVRSTLQVGSTFTVTLPVAASIDANVPDAEPVAVVPSRRRVLIIDDDDIVARGVKRSLDDACDVVRCASAGAALTFFEAGERFDVILCDLMMPKMTGMKLYDEVMTLAPKQARRMMFMTGGAFTSESRRFIETTDVALLEKPFGVAELRTAVQRFADARELEQV